MTYRIYVACLILLYSFNVNAATFHYLQSQELVGQLTGPDGLWDTDDDASVIEQGGVSYSGFNPQGSANNFLFNGEGLIFGSIVGSFETSGPVGIGTSAIISRETDGLTNIFSINPPLTGVGFTETLSSQGGSATLAANNTATASLAIDLTFAPADTSTYEVEGNYFYLQNGQDHNAIFAGNIEAINQFNFLLPLLPENWDYFFIGSEDFEFVAGNITGATGITSTAFYTTAPVPLPAAFWLFTSAIIGLMTVSRKSSAT